MDLSEFGGGELGGEFFVKSVEWLGRVAFGHNSEVAIVEGELGMGEVEGNDGGEDGAVKAEVVYVGEKVNGVGYFCAAISINRF